MKNKGRQEEKAKKEAVQEQTDEKKKGYFTLEPSELGNSLGNQTPGEVRWRSSETYCNSQ